MTLFLIGGINVMNQEKRLIQIKLGEEAGVDTSIYNRPEFNWKQMNQIRQGLVNGLDVNVYANLEYNAEQMGQIRKGLEQKVDIKMFNDPRFTAKQMQEIRAGLNKRLDVSIYAKPEYTREQMYYIRIAMLRGYNYEEILAFQSNKAGIIFLGLSSGFSLSKYSKYSASMIKEIIRWKKAGLDIDPWLQDGYKFMQLIEIRRGLLAGVDVKSLDVKKLSFNEICSKIDKAEKKETKGMNLF